MFCTQCGAQLPDDSRFCSQCGAKIIPESAAQTRQAPQCVHREGSTIAWGWGSCISGLWHQAQRSGHPFRYTLVRMPGPSLTDMEMISPMIPFIRICQYKARASISA